MSTVENKDNNRLSDLTALLEKLTTQSKQCGLQVNWDGHKYTWTISISNVTADEWNPINLRSRPETEHDVPSRPMMVHRKDRG